MNGDRLPILLYPDPRLQRRSDPVVEIDAPLRRLMDDMFATIYATRSVGLAAPQVGVARRLMVIDVSPTQDAPLVFVNPEILSRDMPGMAEEQCLSVPGFAYPVPRALRVRVRALDRAGQPFEMDTEGLLAVCVQHEIDHLDGVLFIDRLSWLKRLRVRLAARHAAPAAAG